MSSVTAPTTDPASCHHTGPGEKTCPACGTAFTCGMDAGADRCWCADLPPLPTDLLDSAAPDCFCPTCLASRSKSFPGAQQD